MTIWQKCQLAHGVIKCFAVVAEVIEIATFGNLRQGAVGLRKEQNKTVHMGVIVVRQKIKNKARWSVFQTVLLNPHYSAKHDHR